MKLYVAPEGCDGDRCNQALELVRETGLPFELIILKGSADRYKHQIYYLPTLILEGPEQMLTFAMEVACARVRMDTPLLTAEQEEILKEHPGGLE